MSGRRRKAAGNGPVLCEIGARSAWFTGNTAVVWAVLAESRVKHMRDPFRKCPTVPVSAVDDVLAMLDLAGVTVAMVAGVAA